MVNNSATYSYDAADQLTSKTNRDGRQTTYSYDSGGRQTGETWVSASPAETITYTYDAVNPNGDIIKSRRRLGNLGNNDEAVIRSTERTQPTDCSLML